MPPAPRERAIRLLRWSEKYFKTDMVYLASGGFWLFLGNGANILLTLGLSVVVANAVEPAVYGMYKYVLSFVAIFSMATLPGIDQALVRSIARGAEGGMLPTLRMKMRWGTIGSAAALAMGAYYLLQGNAELAFGFGIVALATPFMESFTLFNDLLQGRRLFSVSTRLAIGCQVVATAILIGTALTVPTLTALLIAYLGGWTLVRVLSLAYTLKRYPPNSEREEGTSSYGLHLTAIKTASTIAGSIGGIIIFHVLGSTALAVYAFAIAPTELLRGLFGSISALLFPKLSRDEWQLMSLTEFIGKIWFFFAAIAGAILLYVAIAPLLFSVFLPKYLASVEYSRIFMGTLLLSIATLLLSTILQSKQQVRKLHAANVVSICGLIAFTVPAAYLWGIGGLIVAIYASKALDLATLLYLIFWSAPLSENKVRNMAGENGMSVNA